MKIIAQAAGGMTIEIEATSPKQVFKELSFWQSLPLVCPIDGQPTRLSHRNIDDNDYYSVQSTGPIPWEFRLGQYKSGDGLFPKQNEGWRYWNPETREEEVRYAGDAPPKAAGAVAPKQEPTSRSKLPPLGPEELRDLKKYAFEAGVKTKAQMDGILKREFGRAPGDWSNFTSEESVRLLALFEEMSPEEPPNSLFE